MTFCPKFDFPIIAQKSEINCHFSGTQAFLRMMNALMNEEVSNE